MKTIIPQKDYGTCERNVQLKIDEIFAEIFAEKVIQADDSVRLLDEIVEGMDLRVLRGRKIRTLDTRFWSGC